MNTDVQNCVQRWGFASSHRPQHSAATGRASSRGEESGGSEEKGKARGTPLHASAGTIAVIDPLTDPNKHNLKCKEFVSERKVTNH